MARSLLKRAATLVLAVLGAEIAFAVLKRSPELESFDPSGEFGDPDSPALRVAVLGDSSVTAPGVAGPEEIWVSLVCSRLAENHHIVLKSFAVGGSMAHNLVAEQLEDTIDFEPDLIFVSVGANDALRGIPVRVFEKNLDYLISRLAETGATIIQSGVGVMGTIPRLHPPLSTMMSGQAIRFDRAHRRVAAKYGSWVVDHRSDDAGLWHQDGSLWAADDFHVSAAGHARWAETTWRTVAPLMNRSSAAS